MPVLSAPFALGTAVVAAVPAYLLIRPALRGRRGAGRLSAGFVGLGMLAGPLAVVLPPLAGAGAGRVMALGGVCVVAASYLIGLLLLPGRGPLPADDLPSLAFTDQLTGLPNRRALMRTITAQRAVAGHPGALLVLDVQDLTGVNDRRGRETGDGVLVEVARRLRAATGPDDLPARLAGADFAVVTVDGPIQAYGLGSRLLADLTRPYELPGSVVHLRVNIGLADLSGGESVDDALGRADLARRRSRQLGHNRVEWYDELLSEQVGRRTEAARELPGAAGRRELDQVFQPVVELPDRRPVGVEALLRWRHPRLGTLLPGEVVPVAEETGLLGEVGGWVLDAACRQLSVWRAAGWDVWVAVNVSPRQLTAPDFVTTVAGVLANHDAPADRLVVEVAEAELSGEVSTVVSRLAALRAIGVRTALDHFGAGQTSLARLRQLPVDLLKIDASMVDVVAGLGRRLGVQVVAQGLEAEGQLSLVQGGGCRYAQGFLLARPAPAEHVEAYLETHRAPSL